MAKTPQKKGTVDKPKTAAKTNTKTNTTKSTAKKNTSTRKKTVRKPIKAPLKHRILKAVWSFTWKATLAFIAFIVIAGIYFDKKVENRLDGSTWDLPATLYARPLLLKVNEPLAQSALVSELKLLNYRAVQRIESAGQFAVNGNQVTIYRRAFDFPDRAEAAAIVSVSFDGNRIASLNKRQGEIAEFRLDPLLLDRLNSKQIQDRVFVPFQKIPDLLVNTLILMEDREFYHHQGVSPFAILRAFMVNMKAGRTVQGGSTLTQQLAKNLFLSQERSLWRKFQEAYIAVLIDHKYSKDKILESYLNEVYLAQNGATGVYGVGLASDYYFARPIDELRVEQVALLVAIIKGPSYYNPRRNPKRALARRDLVLRLMLEHNYINTAQYRIAVNSPLNLSGAKALNNRANPAFVSLLNRELVSNVPASIRKQSGLSIFTSISPLAQKNAEIAIQSGIKKVQKKGQDDLQGAMVITDRQYAEVRALVSGKDVKFSGFNRALDASRPIGSLVKPAVYLTALDNGYSLTDILNDKEIVLKNSTGQRWRPKNYDRKFRGQVSLEQALVSSLNVPTVNLGMQIGLSNVIDSLHAMGVEQKIKAYPSLVLGSLSLSPFEVAQMYQPIGMRGIYKPLTMIRTIVSSDGIPLYQRSPAARQIFSSTAVNQLSSALHKVTTEGTARSLRWRNPGQNFAGKTGTTNNLNDSWFVGFDQDEVVTTWVGKDNNKSAELTGSSGALVLFSGYMKQKVGQ
ncbi:penicillin-binding protein 1B [Psychromonas sp. 14N.309.X.WAT.B.A12]|uniref:penicillin-binding protein 1B n=1 Tax=unclassified Psychromonas TaxID=2614957 RepID=UPI0025AFF5D7|nr:penicillin-binding protein 1B [Psychromonas sp. 14N.309.X.WAT.B.A12]MDN2665017.1 penicillin-binding protein 1B [Psychromonas sp. 14N.309.X.WAT.B.A12]